jgi:hypothetical protein
MNLTETQKHSIFKSLATKSKFVVGMEFGFDRYYKTNQGVINAVSKVMNEVKKNPEKFAISSEIMDMVERGIDTRRRIKNPSPLVPNDPGQVDERDLVLGAKKKAWVLLNKKLDYLSKHNKAFQAESIMSLAKLAGIVFDKAQIVSGEATEHIALRAKVDSNITPGEALTQLLSFREAQSTNGSED